MSASIDVTSELRQRIDRRAGQLLREHQQSLWRQTDRLFALLFMVQWIACILVANWLSPRAWAGLESHVHPHVWSAYFLGGIIAAGPIFLALVAPGQTITRHVISVGQMLHSALLIHLSGGRIETHFHIFGSLAFLSFYRDWKVLIPATVTIALDHVLRGTFWPQSAFGLATASHLRWLEHVAWVLFEDGFLIWACIRGAKELATLAQRQAELEATNSRVEAEVKRQTERLESISQELVTTARRAGMAEIATGVLHNVGNVLNSVNVSASVAIDKLKNSEIASLAKVGQMLIANQENLPAFLTEHERGKHLPPFLIELADCLGKEQRSLLEELHTLAVGLDHIKEVVSSQQQHAKNKTLLEKVSPGELFEQAIVMDAGLCAGELTPIVRQYENVVPMMIDKHTLLQVLINLLSNARKSVVSGNAGAAGKIIVGTRTVESEGKRRIRFHVSDNGVGIPAENLTRIFAHGFTTRSDGHGFGLHSAANAVRQMNGDISVSSAGPGKGATFAVELPLLEQVPQQ